MDEQQMLERCPDAKLIGKYVLKDYRLVFNIFSPKRQCGCADVVRSDGSEVWGLVYELTETDLGKLDGHEAHPNKYKRFTAVVNDGSGQDREVEVYGVVEKNPKHIPPSSQYFSIIADAAEKYHFPETYQKSLKSFTVQPQ